MCRNHAHMQPAGSFIDFIKAPFFGFLPQKHLDYPLSDNRLFRHVCYVTHRVLNITGYFSELATDNCYDH